MYPNIKSLSLVLCLLTSLLGATPLSAVEPEGGDSITIGAIYALTGPAGYWGDYGLKGFKLAIEEANTNGGITGRHLEVFVQDSQTKPARAASSYRWLRSSKEVQYIAGDVWTFLTNAFLPMAGQENVLVFSALNMEMVDVPENFINLGTRTELTANATTQFFRLHPEVKKAAVFGWDDVWGHGYLQVWREACQQAGVDIVFEHLNPNDYSEDYRAVVAKALRSKPDVILVSHFAERIVRRFAEQQQFPLVLSTSNVTEVWVRKLLSERLLEGIYYLDWLPSGEFIEKFEKRYGHYPLFSAPQNYDLGRLLVKALRLNSADPLKVIKTLKYDGVTGPIDLTKSLRGNYSQAALMQIKDGRPVAVDPGT